MFVIVAVGYPYTAEMYVGLSETSASKEKLHATIKITRIKVLCNCIMIFMGAKGGIVHNLCSFPSLNSEE